MKSSFKRYIFFWLSGSISQLGSSMTSFALILWAYTQTGSALSVSLMSFFNFLPYIVVSLLAGGFVDRHLKKSIMLCADTMAAVCSLFVLVLCASGRLRVEHVYLVNGIIGFMDAFQSPAQSIAVGILVPREKIRQASGMDSFASSLVSVLSPAIASAIFALADLRAVILVDLITFFVHFIVLLCFIQIPEQLDKRKKAKSALAGSAEGWRFLRDNKGILYIIVTMAAINFFSRLTYENILSPMILARGGNDSMTLGVVNAVLGIGGIVGGVIVSTGRIKMSSVKMIYFCAAFSFLTGDMLMGMGQNVFLWSLAAIAASLPIPMINAGQRVILYETIPQEKQGSVFSLRNAIQFSTIPLGILLGGYLADCVFEPFMQSDRPLAWALSCLTGGGMGSGMAVMFLCTGVLGFSFSLWAYRSEEIRALEEAEKRRMRSRAW